MIIADSGYIQCIPTDMDQEVEIKGAPWPWQWSNGQPIFLLK